MTDMITFDPPPENGNPFDEHQVTIDVAEVGAQTELELSDEEAKEVLRDADLFHVNLKSIKAHRKLGKYLKTAGMIEYARGKLLGRENAMERSRQKMVEIVVGDEPAPVEVRVSAAMAVVKLVEAENQSTKLGLELERLHSTIVSAAKTGHTPPPPGTLIVVNSGNEVRVMENGSREHDQARLP